MNKVIDNLQFNLKYFQDNTLSRLTIKNKTYEYSINGNISREIYDFNNGLWFVIEYFYGENNKVDGIYKGYCRSSDSNKIGKWLYINTIDNNRIIKNYS